MENQIYFISLIYLLFGGLIILSQRFSITSLILLDLQNSFQKSKKLQLFLSIFGLILIFCEIFYPIYPGPDFFGDLGVIFNILGLVIYYFYIFMQGGKNENVPKYQKETKIKYFLCWEIIICAILHFIFPFLVII